MEHYNRKVSENHWRGGFKDRSMLQIDHYNERGLNLNYFWSKYIFKLTPTSEDMEIARMEAIRVFVQMGGHVILTIQDSELIPENNRNSPIDGRDGHIRFIGKDWLGFNRYAKKDTGNPGDQYYDWKPMTDDEIEKRIGQVRKMLYQEKKQNRNNGGRGR